VAFFHGSGMTVKLDFAFFRNLVVRQIRQDYLHNLTGFAWLILQPLMLLAVYAFVFTTIFKARIPDAGDIGFVPYLAVAFWPWTAFSESVLKANNSITANSALLGKVAFATEQLPLATVAATFLMHMAGFLAVLVVLQLIGTPIHWAMLPTIAVVTVLLWLLASAMALAVSASQVFVRDLAQMLPPLMTFWFFTTPILYSASILPERLQGLFAWNPMTWFVNEYRNQLLFGQVDFGRGDVFAVLGVIAIFIVCLVYFRRFSGHFEDFL
jgi:ABC-type polysaccharide/polyol phosphate export permease